MNAKIVLCKCPRSKSLYGMRTEERGNDWIRTWAFKISETSAKNEKYERERISGSMMPTPEYPGCPSCGSKDILQCSCGKMACYYGEAEPFCPWCERSGKVQIVDKLEFEGDGR